MSGVNVTGVRAHSRSASRPLSVRLGAAAGPDGEEALRAEIVDALAHNRKPDGSYRLENEYHYLIARLTFPAPVGEQRI